MTTLIAQATGSAGSLAAGTNVPGTLSTHVTDGAETPFDSIVGPGTDTTTVTIVANPFGNGYARALKLHQGTSVVTVGWKAATITSQLNTWVVEKLFQLGSIPTGSCNFIRGYSDGALATSVFILRISATGTITVFMGTGNTTVLSPSWKPTAGVNYAVGVEVVSAVSLRVVFYTVAVNGALTVAYDSGVVAHSVVAAIQSINFGLGSSSSGAVDDTLQVRLGSGAGLFTTPVAASSTQGYFVYTGSGWVHYVANLRTSTPAWVAVPTSETA